MVTFLTHVRRGSFMRPGAVETRVFFEFSSRLFGLAAGKFHGTSMEIIVTYIFSEVSPQVVGPRSQVLVGDA